MFVKIEWQRRVKFVMSQLRQYMSVMSRLVGEFDDLFLDRRMRRKFIAGISLP